MPEIIYLVENAYIIIYYGSGFFEHPLWGKEFLIWDTQYRSEQATKE